MAFNFGASKFTAGFGLTTTTAGAPIATTTPQLNFAAAASGDSLQTKTLFSAQTTAAPAASFSFGPSVPTSTTTATSAFTLNPPAAATSATTLGFTAPASTATAASGFSLGLGTTTPSSSSVGFSLLGTQTKSTAPLSVPSATPTTTLLSTQPTSSILPSTPALTFSQLEDAINKWTLDLEEQGKVFCNQAKHLNAWDRLLIGNGEKILNVSSGIERVKQQQQKLDQDLDFVLAQQNELEDCIAPLEKELQDIPIADTERDQTYKLAENIDSQLKQMSEDLKEIIDHLNESNKAQEQSDPVSQIGRILSAHMNSLQWIDRSTSQISSQLDEISKLQEVNMKKNDLLLSKKYNY